MKRSFSILLAAVMAAYTLTGCGLFGQETKEVPVNKTAAICIPTSTNADYTDIRDRLTQALANEGYTVQAIDAGLDTQNMINQIQNFKVNNVGFLYVLPVGDPEALNAVLSSATETGIKTLVSHGFTGENSATAYVLSDEFIAGAMMAPMVSQWISATFPTAAADSVKVAVLEQSLTPDRVKRSMGMKLIAEKFLRKIDLTTGQFIETDGAATTYIDSDGTEKAVSEPTGGLILTADGRAQLNPFYDARVMLVEFDNRSIMTADDARTAVADAYAAYPDIKAMMCFCSDTATGANEKMMTLVSTGALAETLPQLAVFGADNTPGNAEAINQSAANTSLLRGVVTRGDITATIVATALKMIKGEGVPATYIQTPGYLTLDASGKPVEVTYNKQLPETEKFLN